MLHESSSFRCRIVPLVFASLLSCADSKVSTTCALCEVRILTRSWRRGAFGFRQLQVGYHLGTTV
jgi:hypothetical protein